MVPDDRAKRIKAVVEDLRRIDPAKRYFQFTLTAKENGEVGWGCYSHFVDFTDDTCRFELREASLVKAALLAATFDKLRERWVAVNSEAGLHVYLRQGGHGFVEEELAKKWLPELIAPSAVARSGSIGFRALASVSQQELQRAPSKKQRLRILKRDGYRCRICGERPADNVHITLHVHHVRMWSKGGLTEDENLITLCQSCHDGLEPHEDLELLELIPGLGMRDRLNHMRTAYAEGVARYRERVRTMLDMDDQTSPEPFVPPSR